MGVHRSTFKVKIPWIPMEYSMALHRTVASLIQITPSSRKVYGNWGSPFQMTSDRFLSNSMDYSMEFYGTLVPPN